MEGPEIRKNAEQFSKLVGSELQRIEILRGQYATSIDKSYTDARSLIERLSLAAESKGCKIDIVSSIGKTIIIGLEIAGEKLYLALRGVKMSSVTSGRDILKLCGDHMIYFSENQPSSANIDVLSQSEYNSIVAEGLCLYAITLEKFIKGVRNYPSKEIINVLSNPKVIDGIGTVYRCEALYIAKIDPFTAVEKLSDEDIERLFKSVRFVALNALTKEHRFVYGKTLTEKGEIVQHVTMLRRPIWYVNFKK